MTAIARTMVTSPTLVLLPGLDGTGRMFDAFLNQRPQGQDVHIIRYPGDRRTSYDELLELVWDELPRDRPYVLLGESFSGPLAIRAAARQPQGLRGVILCASFVTSPTPWYVRWPSMYTTSVVQFLIWAEAFAMRWLVGRCSDELRRLTSESTQSVSPRVIAARVRDTMRVNVTQELREITSPILYLGASWDVVVPKRSQALIRRLRPDVDVRTIDGPHAILQTRAEAAWAVVTEWCGRLAPHASFPANVLEGLPRSA